MKVPQFETPENIRIPRLVLQWTPGRPGTKAGHSGLELDTEGLNSPLLRRESNGYDLVAIGCPVIGDRIDLETALERMGGEAGLAQIARGLGGQFLLIRAGADRIEIANDRFTSIPLYWARIRSWLAGSLLYDDLIPLIRTQPGFAWRPEAMIEFIWLQKLLHTKTYDSLSSFLPAASVLAADAGKAEVAPYWTPDYTKREYASEHAACISFNEQLTQSLRRLTSDSLTKRYAHFLSGGHDSRTVLAAAPVDLHCFTCAFSDNYEVSCARRAAAAKGTGFSFIELPDDLFIRYQEVMSRLCGGMYATDHALFLGFSEALRSHADVALHGHGFDYMYQGMYLPTRTIHWFGRPTFYRRLQPFDGDIVARFKDGISFGMLDSEARGLVKHGEQAHVEDFVQQSVVDVLKSGESYLQTDADRWEHLINHALARHYSYPNIISKATLAEIRTPSFDNDLYDFYLSLPNRNRVSAQMLRYVLNNGKGRLGRIPTGNLGIPAGASPTEKTLWLIGRKALRHMTGNQRFMSPAAKDRTWPDRDTYIRAHPGYAYMILDALDSDILADTLPLLDWSRTREAARGWLEAPVGGGKFLVSLLTLHGFLKRHA